MWSVSTILTGLYSFMIESNPTLGSIETTARKKKQLAAQSLQWNVEQNPPFVKLFPQYMERYEEEKRSRPNENESGTASALGVTPRPVPGVAALPPSIATILAGLVAILSILLVYRFT